MSIDSYVAFPYAIACMYVITDLDAVLNTSTGLPLIELYYQATGSKAASSVLMAAFALCLFAGCTGNVTSTSRQMWSASRDNCFPLSRYWSQVSPTFNMPLNAACLEGVVVSVCNLNPPTAVQPFLSTQLKPKYSCMG